MTLVVYVVLLLVEHVEVLAAGHALEEAPAAVPQASKENAKIQRDHLRASTPKIGHHLLHLILMIQLDPLGILSAGIMISPLNGVARVQKISFKRVAIASTSVSRPAAPVFTDLRKSACRQRV